MKRKISIIGAGTGGAVTAAYFSSLPDCEVEWFYNSQIPTQAVGEGTNLTVPGQLYLSMGFSYGDLDAVDGTPKLGISKYNWGVKNEYFVHEFPVPNFAYHFNAVKLQKYIMDKLSNKIKISDKNVTHDSIDANYIIDCSGRPKTFEDYNIVDSIPVNSVYVTQCFWPYPTINTTLTIARKYGWVFGIPLKNRCAIGYLYNNQINSLDDIKEDVQEVFKKFNLQPSDKTNAFSFSSYYRKVNFTKRVMYNGNASFFIEPLEATSIGNMMITNLYAYQLLSRQIDLEKANELYTIGNEGIVSMILLHYFAGSKFKNEFWDYATGLAEKEMQSSLKKPQFKQMITDSLNHIDLGTSLQQIYLKSKTEYGTWPLISYYLNILGLGVEEKLKTLISSKD